MQKPANDNADRGPLHDLAGDPRPEDLPRKPCVDLRS